jgi:hypothetical protein
LAQSLLEPIEISMLRTQSLLSGMPAGGTLATPFGYQSLVAMDGWILPKYTFVALWIWLMLGGQAYAKRHDHKEVDSLLISLNPDQISGLPKLQNAECPVHLINHIWNQINAERWTEIPLDQKREILDRVLSEADQPMS